MVVPQKINIDLPHDPAIPLQGAHPTSKSRDSNRSCVHQRSYQHYSQQTKYENNQISTDEQVNKIWYENSM